MASKMVSGLIYSLKVNLHQLEDGHYEVPKDTVFHIGDKIGSYHVVVHLCCDFSRDDKDLKQLERSKIIHILEKALTDKRVTDVCIHVIITENSIIDETALTKDIKVNMKIHSSINDLITIEELMKILWEYLTLFGYTSESISSGILISADNVTLKDGNKIPEGTLFNYYPEQTNTHRSLKTVNSDYELRHFELDNTWTNIEPIVLQDINDDTKPKMLMVIITYYFELKEALENPPFSAQCITNFLAEELQSDFDAVSVLVVPPISNAQNYTVKISHPFSIDHIPMPESLIGVTVATENTNKIPNIQSLLKEHFTVTLGVGAVNFWVLPQVPPPTPPPSN